jgi:hypothetical protein
MILLFILDILSEFIFLTYQTGQVVRKYFVPAMVFVYVVGERTWDYITPTEDWWMTHSPMVYEIC